ncbi:C-type lectin 37Da [Chionoecetes opilio]|uniref:C-type lectin 37Da n=1 Tax=Chionoecetes opilio TaxID=41210 RepID=A0A8J4XTP3_CHIOP|nr:C-type lectin 37Da [Chionoecetes opilio]
MWRSVAVALVLALVSLSAGQRSVETIDLAGSRYFISQTSPYVPTLNWFLAYQYCRTIGMELLTIATAEEAEVISSYLAENRLTDTDYWTGGNQLGSHLWMWMATGQRFNSSFDNWAPEQAFV